MGDDKKKIEDDLKKNGRQPKKDARQLKQKNGKKPKTTFILKRKTTSQKTKTFSIPLKFTGKPFLGTKVVEVALTMLRPGWCQVLQYKCTVAGGHFICVAVQLGKVCVLYMCKYCLLPH
jgi:hypothetical protein